MRLILVNKGGKGSGPPHGHAGRPGKRGGSAPSHGKVHHHHEDHHHHHHKVIEPKKKIEKKIEKPETVGFSDEEIPEGWTKFSHESIVKSSAGGTRKVYIFKYANDSYSMQRRYLGNPLPDEVRKPAPLFPALKIAVRKAEEWLGGTS